MGIDDLQIENNWFGVKRASDYGQVLTLFYSIASA
jgi:hypothetical protein